MSGRCTFSQFSAMIYCNVIGTARGGEAATKHSDTHTYLAVRLMSLRG